MLFRSKPLPGRPDLKMDHEGVTYRFANEANLAQFRAAPDKFKPQYNGFCSNGMVYAIPLGGNHDTFKIINGRLFMFGGEGSKNILRWTRRAICSSLKTTGRPRCKAACRAFNRGSGCCLKCRITKPTASWRQNTKRGKAKSSHKNSQ